MYVLNYEYMYVQIFKFCSTTSVVESLGMLEPCIVYKLFKKKSFNIVTLQDHTTSRLSESIVVMGVMGLLCDVAKAFDVI